MPSFAPAGQLPIHSELLVPARCGPNNRQGRALGGIVALSRGRLRQRRRGSARRPILGCSCRQGGLSERKESPQARSPRCRNVARLVAVGRGRRAPDRIRVCRALAPKTAAARGGVTPKRHNRNCPRIARCPPTNRPAMPSSVHLLLPRRPRAGGRCAVPEIDDASGQFLRRGERIPAKQCGRPAKLALVCVDRLNSVPLVAQQPRRWIVVVEPIQHGIQEPSELRLKRNAIDQRFALFRELYGTVEGPLPPPVKRHLVRRWRDHQAGKQIALANASEVVRFGEVRPRPRIRDFVKEPPPVAHQPLRDATQRRHHMVAAGAGAAVQHGCHHRAFHLDCQRRHRGLRERIGAWCRLHPVEVDAKSHLRPLTRWRGWSG